MRRLGLLILLALGLVAIVATAPSVVAGSPAAAAHPEPGDVDGDGVRDEFDNCPQTRNANQTNVDRDGQGDWCDRDADGDGLENRLPPYRAGGADNCPLVHNPDQADTGVTGTAGNGIGDACDRDDDGDTVTDARDNCLGIANPDQADFERDGVGDTCDLDDDEDGEFDTADNCPLEYNPLQEDADGDGIGTWCDASEPTAGGGGDGTGGGPAGRRDTTAPALAVKLARTQRMRELGRSLAVEVGCDEGCAVRARLTVDRRTARRLRVARTVASGSATLGGRGTTYVFMRFRGRAARRLSTNRTVRAVLQVTASDGARNARTEKRAIRLRR